MADPTIKIKRSAVAGKIPTPDQVPLGEIALNTYDGYLYASKNVGIGTTVIAINPFRVGTGTDSYNAYFTAGNVGIGSTLPTSALTVQGNVSISGVVTATSFVGNLTGNADTATSATSATNANNINISATTSSDTVTYLALVGSLSTGNQSPFIDSGLYYNASNNTLFATTFSGTTVSASSISASSVTITSALDLLDNDPIRIGTGDDWEMYHNGTSNYIDLNNGDIIIRDDGTAGDPTRLTLGRTTGDVTTTGDVYVADDKRLYFGAGTDLAIFHNSTNNNSVISELGSGNLNINATEHTFNDPTGSETKARFITNGAVELYYDNVLEFETTGYGVTVYGTLQSQQVNVSGVVTATSFVGDGSNITGISTLNIVDYGVGLGGGGGGSGDSYWISNSAGIHTLSSVGIGTTNPNAVVTVDNTGVLAAGIVTAYKFYGDGSNITGISAVARVTVSQTAPASPTAGDLWYHSTQARLFVYYTDADSSQWVDAAPFNGGSGGSGASVSVGATAPIGPLAGDLWYNSDYGRLFIYYSDEDSQQWVDAAPFNFSGITTATYTENSFVATAGQTSFTVSYEVGYVDVFLNGIRLSSSEYTASDGSSVVLDDGATEGDVVDIIEVATNRGPTGARGPAGETTLAGVTSTTDSTTYYPLFTAGIGSTVPYVSVESNYFGFTPSSGTLTVNQLNVGVTTLGVTTATNLTVQSINCSGVATALDFNSTSDVNLKKDVKVIDEAVSKVSQLNGVSFNWTDTGQSSAGVIAQDVEKVMPEIIRNNPTGYKSLNYNGLIGLLIEAVKEQNETIKSLEQKINTLEERLS